jgi:HSP20 family protein
MTQRRDVDRLWNELEDLVHDVWHRPRFSSRRYFRPAVDCFRTLEPAELVVVVELAGVDPESVEVIAGERALVIAGVRRRPRLGKGGQVYQQMEIDYGPFERRIILPDDVETGEASATYEQGLLRIVFPIAQRQPQSEPVPIKVRRRA